MPKLSLCLILAASLFPFAASPVSAQGPALALRSEPYEARFTGFEDQEIQALKAMTCTRTDREYRSSHWQEGLVLGAVLGGVFGTAGLYTFCQGFGGEDECELKALMGGAMGAVVGGGLGALIGGLFPKPAPENQEDHSAPNASR
jgi:hypothetical protein